MPKKNTVSYDIITIGEAGLDIFLKIHDASVLCNLDKENCWLCLQYADKIPVEEYHESLGHNACNVAVGIARLGLKPALYAIIGDDETGEKILRKLKREQVSTEYVLVQKQSMSATSIVLRYKTERTILIYHVPRTLRLPKLAKATWVYLTSLGKGFERVHDDVLSQLHTNGWRLAFNPGDQQLRAGVKKLMPIFRACSLLIVNKEEASMLLAKTISGDIKNGLQALRMLGPEIVIITDGPKGAYGFDGHEYYESLPLPSKVVERTGAGDSFSTGVIAALSYGKRLSDALLWGAANAASVIEHIGPQKGLLTEHQIKLRIKKGGKRCIRSI